MKVFYNGDAKDISVSACPAGHLPAVECPKDWFEEDGATPRTFPVIFRNGETIVPESLGKYLVAERIARTSRIIMPHYIR